MTDYAPCANCAHMSAPLIDRPISEMIDTRRPGGLRYLCKPHAEQRAAGIRAAKKRAKMLQKTCKK